LTKLQDKTLVHRKASDATGAGSMFEDKDGDVIVHFNQVADVPAEAMHLLGGGIFKKLNTVLPFMATRVRVDKTNAKSGVKSILDPDVEERAKFYNKFTLREQQRDLR
jgi:hypothetical protein